jgi:Ni,Fe-hydrogenase I small subunit
MKTTEQDHNRTALQPLSTLTQQGGLSQIKAGMIGHSHQQAKRLTIIWLKMKFCLVNFFLQNSY